MGNALLAVRLLLSDTQTEAAELAQELNTFNLLRKEQENGILTDIQRQTPTPAKYLNLLGQSLRCGLITAYASGSFSPT